MSPERVKDAPFPDSVTDDVPPTGEAGASSNGAGPTGSKYAPSWGKPGKTGKRAYVLAKPPGQDDRMGLCEWLTLSLGLDPAHPVISGRRLGTHDIDGSAVLQRADAPPLWFAPITRLATPGKLLESIGAGMTSSDRIAPPLAGEHCPQIFAAVRWLCDTTEEITTQERVGQILRTFLMEAQEIPGFTTYGTTSGQRYELARALSPQRDDWNRQAGPFRYLIDTETRELVIRVSDLQSAARAAAGSGLRRGELEALLIEQGFARIVIDGFELPGRAGRLGPHAHVAAFRGPHIPTGDDADDADPTVNK